MSKFWVEHETYGCPIGGPFDLWRQNYFMANGEPPEDTAKLYPGLRPVTVNAVAVATVNDGATLDDLLARFGEQGPLEQLTMATATSASGARVHRSCPTQCKTPRAGGRALSPSRWRTPSKTGVASSALTSPGSSPHT